MLHFRGPLAARFIHPDDSDLEELSVYRTVYLKFSTSQGLRRLIRSSLLRRRRDLPFLYYILTTR
jgi:hypothetical protein